MKKIPILFLLFVISLPAGAVSAANEAEDKDVFDIGKLVVTPSKIYQPYKYSISSVDIVTSEDIEDAGMLEFSEAVQMSPSVEVLEYGSFGSTRSIRLRGANSQQTLALMDGRSVNSPRDGLADFNLFPSEAIERVEVVRGPRSLTYGSGAVGGVINIIPKQGEEDTEFGTNLTYGDFSTRATDQFLRGSYKQFDYYLLNNLLESNGYREHSGFQTHRMFTNLGYKIGEGRLSVQAGRFFTEAEAPGLTTWLDLDDTQYSTSSFVDVTYRGDVLENGALMLKAYTSRDRIEFVETENPLDKYAHTTNENAVEGEYAYSFDIFDYTIRPLFGFQYKTDKIDSTSSGKHDYDMLAGYIETELRFFDSLTFDLGARLDDYSNFGNETCPSVGASWWLKDTVKLRSYYTHSFRAPTFNDLYWPTEDWGPWGGVEGNANLTPETSDTYEFGADYLWSDKVNLGLTYFHTKYDDLIEWVMDDTLWSRPQNIGKAEIDGIEFVTLLNLPYSTFAELSYMRFTKAENAETGKWLTYRPKHTYKAILKWDRFERCKVSFEAHYKTGRYTTSNNTKTLGDVFRVDMSISSQINDNFELILKANNLFDREYEDIENYPTPGRSLFATVRARF